MNAAVVIPAYKPDRALVDLVEGLLKHPFEKIVIIDDGNSEQTKNLINPSNEHVVILRQAVNLGKGRALKTAFNHVLNEYPSISVVTTADADGQHSIDDIVSVTQNALMNSKDLVLGCRTFSHQVPLRSKLGNSITAFIFKFLIGLKISDTQTGLRAIPAKNLKYLMNVKGERYEYETNVLLKAKQLDWSVLEVPIETIYIENNKSSHFNPLRDSMRIYFLIFRFFASSASSAVVDFTFFALFTKWNMPIAESVLGARFISGWFNFYVNKNLVFNRKVNVIKALIRYWALVVLFGSISSILVTAVLPVLNNVLVAKIVVDSLLFIGSFAVQREFIFSKNNQ
jgi:glycosyltransferase involved in cell wall biosynthesis